MPNTPALVGEGMSALCPNEMVTEKDLEDVLNIFNSFGQTEIVSEINGCCHIRKWFFTSLCIYDYRSDGRCCCTRWYAKKSSI